MDSKWTSFEKGIYRWVGIGFLLIILVGMAVTGSYAFFTATIEENNSDNKTTVITAANLEATFNAGTALTLKNAVPGDASDTKTITMKNTGSVPIDYVISWLSITNDDVTDDNGNVTKTALTGVKYTVACDSASVIGTGTKLDMPTKAGTTLISGTLSSGATHTCTIQLFYTDTNADQSTEMGNNFKASLTASATLSTTS